MSHGTRALLVLLCVIGTRMAPAQGGAFLVVKPGDPAATQELAGEFLGKLAGYLGTNVARFEGQEVRGWIANRDEDALRILETRPQLAFVPVGFYLKYLRGPAHAAHVVAEIPRFGKSVERYYIAVRSQDQAGSLADLEGREVSTANAIDWRYLEKVVFPPGMLPGQFFELKASKNLSDDVFVMTQEEGPAPDGLLLDEELKQFFASDDLVWPHLKIVWTSEPLPRDLVVALGPGWTATGHGQLLDSLGAMKSDEAGMEILRLMRSDGFRAPDRELLRRTAEAYDRPPPTGRSPR